jgi:Zn-dependent protease with chaperone function
MSFGIHPMRRAFRLAFLLIPMLGCVALEPAGGGSSPPRSAPTPAASAASPAQAARLQRVMVPLLKVMDQPVPVDRVSVGIMKDPQINAANAGGGRFFVTTGLLEKANDDRLRAVLAHEIAHEDLNHVAKAQVLAAGLGLGAVLIDQVFPGTGQIAPIAGELVARKYSRTEEFAADRHGVELLERAGYRKELMIEGLTWLTQVSGDSGGGFFSTHPGTVERIAALRGER